MRPLSKADQLPRLRYETLPMIYVSKPNILYDLVALPATTLNGLTIRNFQLVEHRCPENTHVGVDRYHIESMFNALAGIKAISASTTLSAMPRYESSQRTYKRWQPSFHKHVQQPEYVGLQLRALRSLG